MRVPDWFHKEHQDKEIESVAVNIGKERALAELDALATGLASGWSERQVQAFLKVRRYLLLGRHRTGHGTFAFPEAELGCQYKIDWAVANGSSAGLVWELIELECPRKKPFLKNGHLSESARKGCAQIQDWRAWVRANLDYAQRPRAKQGQGLYEIDANYGVVVAGSRARYQREQGCDRYNAMRRTLKHESHIEIISYETFIESLRFRFEKSPR